MRLSVPLVTVSIALVAGCGPAPPLYVSEPSPPALAVDGDVGDWPGPLRPVPQEAGLSLGLRNADGALTVAVIATDERQVRRIARGGLRLWVDPGGGTERVLGLRFPAPGGQDVAQAGGRHRGGADPQALRRRFEAALDRVEIWQGDSVRVVGPGSVDGLETAAQWAENGLAVEVQISLAPAEGLLAVPAGGTVGLGIELVDLPVAGRWPAAGPGGMGRPDPRVRPDEDAPDLPTTVRWLRVDLAD